MNQLQTADRELIQTYILIFLDARDAGDMAYLGVLGLFEILQDSPSGNHAIYQMIDTKAFQVLHIEVAQQFLLRSLFRKHPVVELESKVFCTEVSFKFLLLRSVMQNLLW